MGMSLIVKKVTQLVIALIYIFGMYIIFFGHIYHGGGFPGGLILGCGLVLIMLAFGKNMVLEKINLKTLRILGICGLFAYLIIGLLGFFKGSFLMNFIPMGRPFYLNSGGFIPLLNLVSGIQIFALLFLAIVSLTNFGRWVESFKIEPDEHAE